MYSAKIVSRRRAQLERALGDTLPRGLVEYSTEEVKEFRFERFANLFDKHGKRTRELTPEEDAFVLNEQLLGKIDYRYFAERYSTINIAGQATGSLYPLFESQVLILAEIGRVEFDRVEAEHPDGVCVDILKARQLGASSLSVSILAHRTLTHSNVFSLICSDVPDNADFLFDMYERTLDNLPWYLMPTVAERVKNDEIAYATGTRVFHGASKSTRGADKSGRNATDGAKGNLGRGKTLSVVHQSEIATWTNPSQIDTALEPAIAVSPMTFWIKESTAQGRGTKNWWYNEWQLAKSGKSRAIGVFIPWYAERSKYTLPAPVNWSPSEATVTHARRAEENGPRWMHRPVHLTRNQLYWYEKTRSEKESKGLLAEFLQEYPADDEEAFQYSGQAQVVSPLVLARVRDQARPIVSMIEVLPQREVTAWRPSSQA